MKKYRIVSLDISDVNYKEIEKHISKAIQNREKITIAYATAHIVNLAKDDKLLQEALSTTDIIHPEGNGVWLASKLLYAKGFAERFNWTDHAKLLLKRCAIEGWNIFILGSTTDILQLAAEKIQKDIPNLKIVGMKNGFEDVETGNLIETINSAKPDILWLAMGSPKQNLWSHQHKHELNCSVIQAVGDAITLLAGLKKRGPKFIQFIGLEWFVRFLFNPVKYFSRYVVGIPLFLVRVLIQKIQLLRPN
ncbi:MAG: WecB/TagA/CpsF family glycosyltransferase [Bacteroidota bacterium]